MKMKALIDSQANTETLPNPVPDNYNAPFRQSIHVTSDVESTEFIVPIIYHWDLTKSLKQW